jgi:hypothetical protein
LSLYRYDARRKNADDKVESQRRDGLTVFALSGRLGHCRRPFLVGDRHIVDAAEQGVGGRENLLAGQVRDALQRTGTRRWGNRYRHRTSSTSWSKGNRLRTVTVRS